MVRPTRTQQIPNLQDAIKDTAWEQIAETGAAALSLRAIARALKITAPAIYNYFPSRDDLVTALIADAFGSLADSLEAASLSRPANDFGAVLSALGVAYRKWAITYPQRYLLIFGTPIPGYEAPDALTLPAATRGLVPLIKVLQAAAVSGQLQREGLAPLSPRLRSMLKTWQKLAGGAEIEALYLALVFWSRVHGLVMMEVGHQFPAAIDDPGELFRRELNSTVHQYLKEAR
ncbi:MAG TPA: TetR/AcrR family transcriptional regulator [Anaerolineales bacterium]